ncbi:MAG: hypothetical protein M1480_18815 [Bacteroidetes bacterium]|nr:hypothetical protein [Bacteroidota bacterium]
MKKIALLLFVLPFLLSFTKAQNLPKFSGLMFGDYYYVQQYHDQTQKDLQAFEFRRIYLTADYTVSDGIWARFRLESDPTASNLGNNKLSTMVKDAFLDFKNVGNGDLVLGLQGTWNINMAEGIFGYRPLEKTIQDLHGISASRDLGISLTQKFSDAFSAGLLLGNNTGNGDSFLPGTATNASQARYKSGYLFLQFNPMKELTILVDGQYYGAPKSQYGKIGDVIVNYANSSFSLGVQAFLNAIDHGEADGSTLERNGISLNGWIALTDNIRLVARYDNYTPDSNTKNTTIANSTQSFILGALDFAVRKNVHIMPNIEYTSYGLSGSKADVLLRGTFFFSF